jgi:uncharacterized protein YraI
MKSRLILSAAAAALLGFTSLSMAQTAVTATTDLNVRAGPGPEFEVISVIGAEEQAMLTGCLEGSKWCQVEVDGTQGWAYSDYLSADFSGAQVVVTERPAEAVPVVTYETTASTTGGGAVAGATTGAIAGALIGGPVGAVVGGVAGAALGDTVERIDPPETVRTYVSANPVDPVYLEGEVVIGAGIPENVVIREIPDYEYRYVYINGQPVLVEPESRRIVYVMR